MLCLSLVSSVMEEPPCVTWDRREWKNFKNWWIYLPPSLSTRQHLYTNQLTPMFFPTKQTYCPMCLASVEPFTRGFALLASITSSSTANTLLPARASLWLVESCELNSIEWRNEGNLRICACVLCALRRPSWVMNIVIGQLVYKNSSRSANLISRTLLRLKVRLAMSASPHSTSPSRSPSLGTPDAPLSESGRFSPYVQMSAAEPAASAAAGSPGPEVILYESYLQKTPPLKSLVMVSAREERDVCAHPCVQKRSCVYSCERVSPQL